MDLDNFRALVDAAPAGISACRGDLSELYAYVSLPSAGSMRRSDVEAALYERISASFERGHPKVRRMARQLRADLIREHVIRNVPLEPYFQVLNRLNDAVREPSQADEQIVGDWSSAIAAARDHVELTGVWVTELERLHPREFAAASAARALEQAGFAIRLEPGWISLTDEGETKLVTELENLVAMQGGLNVARRIFTALTPHYDRGQQRYHLVPHPSLSGGGEPQVPWGYLLHLAVKHIGGRKPHVQSEQHWRRLVSLATAYAAVIDVQPYAPPAIGNYDAMELVSFLQELALYDTLFRLPQLRPSDVDRFARGMLGFLDLRRPTIDGWTVDQVLEVIGYLLSPVRDVRGPMVIAEADICRALPQIPKTVIHTILEDVLSHAAPGPNQNFSRPTDAPTAQDPLLGHTFYNRPLLKLSGRSHILIDRSVCAPSCLEALLTALRRHDRGLEDKVGRAVERFLEAEFKARNVSVHAGDYDYGREHGECDLVVDTPETLIFLELKKKALTRRARAGSDADLLLDLAGSLLDAQAQCGWHAIRIRQAGALELGREGVTDRVELNGREIERIAVSMLDFGSFQDRIILKHFLEATMNSEFTPKDTAQAKRFDRINASLREIREQVSLEHPGEAVVRQPFFDCWFVSVPQLLALLDDVVDAAGFRAALRGCKFVTTGASDLYYEIARTKEFKALEAAAPVTAT